MRPHNSFIVKTAALIIVALLAVTLNAFAQVTPPGRINYQGVLRDAAGNPLNGLQTMTFRFYDAATAGNLLWEEICDPTVYPPQVTVSGGLFTVALGDATHRNDGSETVFTDVFSKHTDVYLAVRVGSDPEMTPRIKVVSAPFAVNSSALGGLDSTAYAKLANAETITADWVNTAHPWSDNEVSNVLTLSAGSTIDSSIAVGNADTLDTFDSSYFLNTSSTAQTKAGKLTLNGTLDYGLEASGPSGGAYLHDSNGSGYAYVGYGDYGIKAYGNEMGGFFEDLDSTGYARVGHGDRGIEAYGNDTGGYFQDLDGSGYAYVGYGDYGIKAYGNYAGGYFRDSDNSGHANVGYGDRGIEAYGNDMGGYFKDADGSGYANVGYGDLGIAAYGNEGGGFFGDSNESGYAYVGYSDSGIEAHGKYTGGAFVDSDNSGYAYVAYGDFGIEAHGNDMGGYFGDRDNSGYAYVAYGDFGIRAYGNTAGGNFTDLNSSAWADVGHLTYKINGSGDVSFVQNHPYDKDKVIVYACPEGDEVATYTRGTAKLVNGEARVKLGQTFKWVTNPDIGLTAHLTPHGEPVPLAVKSLSTTEMVVVGPKDGPQDITFDYLVYGLRIGFEESSIVQEKQQESYIPSFNDHRERYVKYPELRAYNALERFKTMETDVRGPVDELFGNGVIKNEQEAAANNQAVRNNPVPSSLPPLSQADETTVKRHGSTDSEIITDTKLSLPCFVANGSIEAGDVVTMDPSGNGNILKAVTQADPRVLGIAAGQGFRCQGDKAGKKAGTGIRVPVATFGVIECKVDSGYGPILPGDLLVTSPTPGHAMKAPKPAEQGTVIGKALESLDAGTGLIKVLVMLR